MRDVIGVLQLVAEWVSSDIHAALTFSPSLTATIGLVVSGLYLLARRKEGA